ncbi:hypothetical protein [Microbacterium sp. NPDC089188]|uniref:hypothetical protein n=1 Tax=Microbacterium sp. NPDC089188 TaxID=3154971 RepID=UPI0034288CD4
MGLNTLHETISSIRDAAGREHDGYSRATRDIDNDTSLSDAGKTDYKNAERTQAKERLRALRAKEEAAIDTEMRRLEARIEAAGRGVGANDIIAFRDAHDRADNLKDAEEAIPVLKRAFRNNDTSLAHAVFRRAIDAGWTTVINAFIAEKPELSDVVRDLHNLKEIKENSLGRTMTYGLLG